MLILDLRADFSRDQGVNSHPKLETLDGLRTLLSRRAAVILESQQKVVIGGNGVLTSLVATILLTVLMEMALIAFSIAMTP